MRVKSFEYLIKALDSQSYGKLIMGLKAVYALVAFVYFCDRSTFAIEEVPSPYDQCGEMFDIRCIPPISENILRFRWARALRTNSGIQHISKNVASNLLSLVDYVYTARRSTLIQ